MHESTEFLKFYSLLLEIYNANHIVSQRLERENEKLRAENYRLIEEKDNLARRHIEQESLIIYYDELFDKIRQGIVGVVRSWEGSWEHRCQRALC